MCGYVVAREALIMLFNNEFFLILHFCEVTNYYVHFPPHLCTDEEESEDELTPLLL